MVARPCPLDDPVLAGMCSILVVDAPVHNDLLRKIDICGPVVRLGRDCTWNIAALYLAMVS